MKINQLSSLGLGLEGNIPRERQAWWHEEWEGEREVVLQSVSSSLPSVARHSGPVLWTGHTSVTLHHLSTLSSVTVTEVSGSDVSSSPAERRDGRSRRRGHCPVRGRSLPHLLTLDCSRPRSLVTSSLSVSSLLLLDPRRLPSSNVQ